MTAGPWRRAGKGGPFPPRGALAGSDGSEYRRLCPKEPHMMTKGQRFLIFPLAFLVFALGCGGGNPNAPAKVSGKVDYNGKPVTLGTVKLVPKGGGPGYAAAIKPDASYMASDLPVGEMTVAVDTEAFNPN